MTRQRLRFLQFFNSGVVGFMSGVTLVEAGTTFIFGFNERKEQKCRTNWDFTGRALVVRLVILSPASLLSTSMSVIKTLTFTFLWARFSHILFFSRFTCIAHCTAAFLNSSHWTVMCSCPTKCSRRQDFQALVCVNGGLSWSRRRQYMKYLPPVCLWTHEWISVNCFERAKWKKEKHTENILDFPLKVTSPSSLSEYTLYQTVYWWGRLFPVREWNELLHKQEINMPGTVFVVRQFIKINECVRIPSQPVRTCLNNTGASLTMTYTHIQTNKQFKTTESLFHHHFLPPSPPITYSPVLTGLPHQWA